MGEKTDSIVKLGIWIVIIAAIFVVGRINYKAPEKKDVPTEKQETVEFKKYDEMQQELLKNNYEYKYTISAGEEKTILTGKKYNGIDEGYKESSNSEIIKYHIENNIVYKYSGFNLYEYNELYNGFNSSFINIETLFNNLKEYLYNVVKEDNNRTITYNKEGYQVIVKTDINNINKITIDNENIKYELEFSNIGSVKGES